MKKSCSTEVVLSEKTKRSVETMTKRTQNRDQQALRSLEKMFADAERTDSGLRTLYQDEMLKTRVTVDLRAEDGYVYFCCSMPVCVKEKLRGAAGVYLAKICDESEGKITRAELIDCCRTLVMEARMKQPESDELNAHDVSSCYHKVIGFFVTLNFSLNWLDRLAVKAKGE